METAAAIWIMTLPAIIASIVTALNAKKQNAAWRARRAARQAHRTAQTVGA